MTRPGWQRLVAATGVVGAGCVAYGVAIERHWYRLRHVTLRSDRIGERRLPVRLLHVSDIHLTAGDRRRTAFLASLREIPADLVVFTGDLLGGPAEGELLDALVPVMAGRPGVQVLGGNDIFGPTPKSPHLYFTNPDARLHGAPLDTDRVVAGLADLGVTTLHNDTAIIATNAGPVAVGGIDDPHLSSSVVPHPAAVMPADPGILSLGLVHAPYTKALDVLVEAGHEVLMSGHTHGGQVRFPPIGALVGNCDLPLDQIRGPSRYRDRWLHVSPGLGHSIYAPFRFACRPEATLVEIL